MADISLDDSRPTDLRAPGRYPLHLGDTVTTPESSGELFTSIRYNHKPADIDTDNATTSVARGSKPNTASLTIRDGPNAWNYDGTEVAADEHTYVLLRKDNDSYTLERLDALQRYRLTSAPDQTDPEQLKKQFPLLPNDDPVAHDDTASEGELDVHNPFDYRNHLGNGSPKPTAAPSTAPTTRPTSTISKPTTISPVKTAKPTKPNKPDAKPPSKAKANKDPNAPPPRRGRPPKSAAAAGTSAVKAKEASKAKDTAAKPSAQGNKPQAHSTTSDINIELAPDPGEDEDDDLEAEMLKAMEEDDDGAVAGLGLSTSQPVPSAVVATAEEEEEESEEE